MRLRHPPKWVSRANPDAVCAVWHLHSREPTQCSFTARVELVVLIQPVQPRCTRIKPIVSKVPKSGILVTEVITFDKIAPWVILGRS